MPIRVKVLLEYCADLHWTWCLWLLAPLLILGGSGVWSQANHRTLAEVRTLYPNEWGVPYPAGLSYSLSRQHLALLAKSNPEQSPADGATIVVITPYEDLVGTAKLDFVADNAINLAYDDAHDQLLLLNNERAELARVAVGENGVSDPATLARFDTAHLGLANAAGMSVDHAGRQLFILDSGAFTVVSVDLDAGLNLIAKIDLSHLGAAQLRGIAVHPHSYNLFVVNPSAAILYELTQAGQLVNSYDLAVLALVDAGGLAFGPSADLTDDPGTIHLFIADSNLPAVGEAAANQQAGTNRLYLPLIARPIGDLLASRMHPAAANPAQVFGRIVEVALEPEGNGRSIQSITLQGASGTDDAEEKVETGATDLDSTDLELVRFAVIGDFGRNNANATRVAALVDGWNPDFVVTTGDNNYPDGEAATIDDNIGQYYSQFIGNYQGSYGPGSPTNRFWPSLGNHDWHAITCSESSCTGAYFDYFTLPNNERYYDVDLGLVHLFALDSDRNEPDGRRQNSIQTGWLRGQLATSTACYNLVYFHHPPYSSGRHGSNTSMQWPFSAWGVDAVLSGHDHLYERLDVNGTPYFVNGAGGAKLYAFENLDNLSPEATSIVRYNEDHGAMLVTATATGITYQFYTDDGVLIDDYSVTKQCAVASPTASPSSTPTLAPTEAPTPAGTPTSTATPTLLATVPPTATPEPDPAHVIHVPGDVPAIQAAIDLAGDGDVVLVAPGTYHENIRLAGKTLTLASHFHTSEDPNFIDETILDGDGSTVITVAPSVGPETRISGFTIQNGEDGISASARLHILNNRFTGNRDAIDYETGGGFCRNNLFDTNRDDAIDLDGPTEVTIEDNIIQNSGDDGIEIRLHPYRGPTLTIIIRRNIISGTREDGIQLVDYAGESDRVFLIERNVIQDSRKVGLGLMDNRETNEDFRGASIAERIYLFNNTFINNDHGLTGGDNLIALNNIFAGSPTIALKNVDGNSIAAYNLFWGNGTDQQNSNVDTTTTIVADPRLDTNARLLPDSPALDAGIAFFTWNSEIVLDLQPDEYSGAAPDLGAYEMQAEQLFVPLILK